MPDMQDEEEFIRQAKLWFFNHKLLNKMLFILNKRKNKFFGVKYEI